LNTREFVQRIDELIELGKKLLVGQLREESNKTGDSGELRTFFHEVKMLDDDIRGFEHQTNRETKGIDEYGAEEVKEGLAVLEKQRRLILYSGEFGC